MPIRSILVCFSFFTFLSCALHAQSGKIVTQSNGNSIELKWYVPQLINNNCWILERKTNNTEWAQISNGSIKPLKEFDENDLEADTSLKFFQELIKYTSPSERQGIIVVHMVTKTFESIPFSKYCGIYFHDYNTKPNEKYQYRLIDALTKRTVAISSIISPNEKENFDLNFKAYLKKKEVMLDWEINEEKFYAINIYRKLDDKDWDRLNTSPVMISKYENKEGETVYPDEKFRDKPEQEHIYQYKACPLNFFNKEVNCETKELKIGDLVPPKKVVFKDDTIIKRDLILSWERSFEKDVVGYLISRSKKSDTLYETVLSEKDLSVVTENCTIKVEEPGDFYYAIQAIDKSGNLSVRDILLITVPDIIPPEPLKELKYEFTEKKKILLSWNASKEADLKGYQVFRSYSTADDAEFLLMTPEILKEPRLDVYFPEILEGKSILGVVALDSSFNLSPMQKVEVIFKDITPPESPFIKNIQYNEGTINAKWLPNFEPDLKGYNLSFIHKQDTFAVNDNLISRSIADYKKEMKIEGRCSFFLVAIDSANNKSIPSQIFTIEAGKQTKNEGELVLGKIKVKKKRKEVPINWKYTGEGLIGCVVMQKNDELNRYIQITGMLQESNYSIKKEKENITYQVRAYTQSGEVNRSKEFTIDAE